MFCSKCGMNNDDSGFMCARCGSPLTGPAPAWAGSPGMPKPDSFLVWSILATMFCCAIPGVVGIVYAAQVDNKWAMGDYAGAQAAASSAKTWTLVAVGLWVAFVAFAVVIAVIFGGFSNAGR